MKRLFSKRQKKILALLSGNKCELCGINLKKNFEGDHKIPFSRNGKTILSNGQAIVKNVIYLKELKYEL